MSSLVRRIEKQIMKRAGYVRERYVIGKGMDGKPALIPVRRGGVISNPEADSIGYHWPSRIPAGLVAPKGDIRRPLNPARGRRRGKHSKKWVEARKAVRA